MRFLGTEGDFPRRLRAAFEGAGFTEPAVRATLASTGDGISPQPMQIPPLLFLTAEDTALHRLIRLFVLDQRLSRAKAADALAPATVDEAVAIGLVDREGDDVVATLRMVPIRDLVVAVDPPRYETEADAVMPIGGSTQALLRVTRRAPVGRALDVGTGCGVQALLLSRHAGEVVATDVNPRALAMARFNAAVNGVDNVDWRLGSWWEPVAGERFSLIVVNPPFVVTPDAGPLFRNTTVRGDELCRSMVADAAAHLEEGGFAHVIVSWLHPDDDWSSPLKGWVEGLGCDAWLLALQSSRSFAYAASATLRNQTEPESYLADLTRWLRFYREIEADNLGYGAVSLRRRAGASWVRSDSARDDQVGDNGQLVEQIFDTMDFLEAMRDPAALLEEKLQVNPRHIVQRTMRFDGGRLAEQDTTMRLLEGLQTSAHLDPFATVLLAEADGRRPVREVIEAAAEATGTSSADVLANGLPIVRRMFELGFLQRAG